MLITAETFVAHNKWALILQMVLLTWFLPTSINTLLSSMEFGISTLF